jgi:uncharacterized protein (DUF1499 family)
MKIIATIAAVSALIAAVIALAFLVLGEVRFWRLLGDPDLGTVAIETVQRQTSPNDALACPKEFCVSRSDLTTAVYAIPASGLRAAFSNVIASEPKITIVETNDAEMTDRYVQRSATLGFPDTIVVKFLDRPEGQSTLALYSRSRFGESDFGANLARIERWLDKLASHAKIAELP